MIGRVRTGALVFILACCPVAVGAQDPPQASARAAAQLEALNARLDEVTRRAAQGSSRPPDSELGAIAGNRLQLMSALIESAPRDVLRLALSASVRNSLPAAARAQTEEHVDLTGTVEVWYEDRRGSSRVHRVLDTGRERLSMHFASEPPGWTTGERIGVRGVRVQNALALDGGSTSVSGTTAALPGTSGEQKTLMVLVTFRNNPVQPYTPTFASNVVFGTTDGYFRESSAGATWLVGDVLGWFTIDMDSTVCDTTTLASLARQAATSAGANLSLYSRLVYAFPQNACSWWGLGSVGGNPSQSWINGDLALDVAGHELGHNVGLYHSRNMDCGAVPIASTCTVNEYGDTLDLMGASRGHFNAFQKERLGWLAPEQIVTSANGGTYTIVPFEALTSGVKVVKVLKSVDSATGKRTFYYVELRQAIGYDAFMSGWTNVMNGVSIHTGAESGGNTTYLLDMTPETTSWYDPALTGGRTFSDPAAGVSITAISVSPAGATISVTVGPTAPTCTRALPSLTLSSGTPAAINPGGTVAYSVAIANNDSTACSTPTFALSSTLPAGWTSAFDLSPISLAPGASTSTMLRVTAPSTATAGTYTLSASAVDMADPAHAASASATTTVVVPATMQVQTFTDRASYARGSTVVVSAYVASGSSPVSGVSVAFQIRKPDGKTVKATGTTDATGVATYRLRLRTRDPIGTYQVAATVTGSASATASTTFSVY